MSDIAIDVKDVTIRFNLASEKIDNLKEYFIKLLKKTASFSGISGSKGRLLPGEEGRGMGSCWQQWFR